MSTLNPKPDTVWFAQVTDANGRVTNDIPTRRTDHRKFDQAGNLVLPSIPATMRWRWFDSDEDLWVECDLGCCLAGVKSANNAQELHLGVTPFFGGSFPADPFDSQKE